MATPSVELLLSGMTHGDVDKVRQSLSPKVVLRSPILEDAVEGPDAVVKVIAGLLKFIDNFELLGMMEGDGMHSTSFRYLSGDVRIEGMDLIKLDENGLVEDLRVFWRPLPSIVQMQRRIADALGVPKMKLSEESADQR